MHLGQKNNKSVPFLFMWLWSLKKTPTPSLWSQVKGTLCSFGGIQTFGIYNIKEVMIETQKYLFFSMSE